MRLTKKTFLQKTKPVARAETQQRSSRVQPTKQFLKGAQRRRAFRYNVSTNVKGTAFFASSKRLGALGPKEKRTLRVAYRLIVRNYRALMDPRKGRAVLEDKKHGIRIVKGWSGIYRGAVNLFCLKVTAAGKEFFVKATDGLSAKKSILDAKAVESCLSKKRHRVKGFNVYVIEPLIVFDRYSAHYTQTTFVVTAWLNEGEAELLYDLLPKPSTPEKDAMLFGAADNAVKEIREATGEQFDIDIHNVFLKKPNTLWLFDV